MHKHTSGEVTITQEEYDQLEKDSILLNALRNAGVDNWCGLEDAIEEYREALGEYE